MSVEIKGFVFSSDFLQMSEGDFKIHMREKHKWSAKKAKETFKIMHGNSIAATTEDTETQQQGDDSIVIQGDAEVSTSSDKSTAEEA